MINRHHLPVVMYQIEKCEKGFICQFLPILRARPCQTSLVNEVSGFKGPKGTFTRIEIESRSFRAEKKSGVTR